MPRLPMWRRHDRISGPDHQRDVDDEFEFHLEQRIERLRRAGLSDEAARQEALKRFGDLRAARAAYVSMATRRTARQALAAGLQSWMADARYGLRAFRRSPGFALSVVLIAGLGIAINSAVFTALNALFMRPLPVPRPSEIVRVYTSNSGNGGLYGASSYPDYLDFRSSPSLRGLAAYVPIAASLGVGQAPTMRVEARLVSENFFHALEISPAAGRLWSSDDTSRTDAVPVVLGHGFWRRQFASNPTVAGSLVEINGVAAVVVGVVGAEFTGIEPAQVDLYLPAGAHRAIAPGFEFVDDRGARLVKVIGRLAPGADIARAASDLNVVMREPGRVVTVHRAAALVDVTASNLRLAPVVAMLFTITGVLLLIATVNVAGLLLARTVSRGRELAVRLSLGASRLRLVRQLVVESLTLGLMAEIVALAVLMVLPVLASRFSVPEAVHFGLDGRVLAFASIVTLLAALGFSIGPALKGAARDPYVALRESHGTMPRQRARGQRLLVVVQLALSIVLLAAAVLLAQSIRRQYAVDPGFATTNLIAAEFEFDRGQASTEQERAFADETLRQVRQLPGVAHASVTISPPLTSEGARMSIDIPGFRLPAGEALEVPFSSAGPDYVATLGLRLLDGEELRSGGAGAVPRRGVLVNETMARTYWRDRRAIGAIVRLGNADGPAVPVIAVVADARMFSLARPAGPYFYLQTDGGAGSTILVRTATAPAPLKPVLQRMFSGGRQGFALRRVRAMEDIIGASLAEARAFAAVTTAISALALLLAVSALYGLVSYLAAQRAREFGIRLALGATRADVIRLVLSSSVRLAVIGVAVGLMITVLATTALRAVIFTVPAADLTIVLSLATLAATVSVAACLVPALRSASVPPATTLRAE